MIWARSSPLEWRFAEALCWVAVLVSHLASLKKAWYAVARARRALSLSSVLSLGTTASKRASC